MLTSRLQTEHMPQNLKTVLIMDMAINILTPLPDHIKTNTQHQDQTHQDQPKDLILTTKHQGLNMHNIQVISINTQQCTHITTTDKHKDHTNHNMLHKDHKMYTMQLKDQITHKGTPKDHSMSHKDHSM